MQVANQIVMNPRGMAATHLVAAASRAGARGFLDTTGYRSLADIQADSLAVLSATNGPIGLSLTADTAKWITELTSTLTSQWQWVMVHDIQWPEWSRWIESLRRLGIEILVEVHDKSQFARALQLDPNGVILKGNEAGGRIGDSSTLVLLQQWKKYVTGTARVDLPFWVQGGVGPNTAAGCFVAGACGVVLDSQLVLCRESPLDAETRRAVAALDGSETRVVGQQLGDALRICPPRGSDLYDRLITVEEGLIGSDGWPENDKTSRIDAFRQWIDRTARQLKWPVLFSGQEIALAKSLADQFVTVSGVIQAICDQAVRSVQLADELKPIAPHSTLAKSHQTQFPILQGPMTRVSDTAEFATAVAAGGGLPFLALALMRGPDVDRLLTQTAAMIPDSPWGVGLLGFLPPEIRAEQTAVIVKHKPPFAIIAGGRPDQARELEELGIPTYLHVPSPGLLRRFLKDGARRFIFEGRECGGHVGPRSSFLLWETMIEILLEHIGGGRGEDLHIVFAGGIHDTDSAAIVATLGAPLAARGARIGLLMGTAYLFTQEAVAAGAIVERFQRQAIAADSTVLFETGPGHAVRCLKTPYYDDFVTEKTRLRNAGKAHDEIVKSLEMMNIGRLRVASKGIDRVARGEGIPRQLAPVGEQEQFERGMYMIGQVASLRDRVTTIADLHHEVTTSATERIRNVAESLRHSTIDLLERPSPCDIAIVGMACYYPGAKSLSQFWENTLRLQYEVQEIPGSHWDWRLFYDPDPRARDKIVSKWGAFLGDIPFDPLRYGITPKSVLSIEPLQLLLLECVREAIDDAGYTRRPFNRERTAAVLGIGGGGSPMAVAYGFRSCLPLLDNLAALPLKSHDIMKHCDEFLPEWTEDSFPGFLLNVAVGRIANRFDFGGSNYAIDAACASSLAAVHACVRELEQGTADVAVAMGADTVQTPYAFMAFSKTHALSPQGRCRPFDAQADGIVLSEGIGAVVLKRLADAERDGDSIYAVIRGVGASSDGKEKGLTAPNAAGQLRALRRAYDKAGISPSRVSLIEAHGTGTVVGDRTEAAALAQILSESGAAERSCALGSVKSLIGHSKCAAGIAGLIKTAKAIHHKILPPTLVESPNPQVASEGSPLFLNTLARPWIHATNQPRCAGVSAFGFGGTNVHLVLEEYRHNLGSRDSHGAQAEPPLYDWPTEVFVWRGPRALLVESLTRQIESLTNTARPRLAEYAASLWRQASPHTPNKDVATLAIVAGDQVDLVERMQKGLEIVTGDEAEYVSPHGIYFTADSQQVGRVAFLFPGQGSQYPNMAADAAMNFDDVRDAIDLFTTVLQSRLDVPLGRQIYPPSAFEPAHERMAAKNLARTDVAQPAIGAVSLGLLRLLQRLNVQPDVVAGHSYGEFVALHAAGVFDAGDLARLSHVRGELMRESAERSSQAKDSQGQSSPGGMAAVSANQRTVAELLADVPGVTLANLNAPEQTVISASDEALRAALDVLSAANVQSTRLDVACAFHSPAVADACQPLADEMDRLDFQSPRFAVYSNTSGALHTPDVRQIKRVMAAHIASPVRFLDEIQTMYADGVRIFVEVGPQRHLSGLVRRILADQPHVTAATDVKDRDGISQIQHCVAQLLCAGVAVDLAPLFERRVTRTFDPRRLAAETGIVEYSRNTWMINGIRSRIWNAPEPKLLGQRWDDDSPGPVLPATISSDAPKPTVVPDEIEQTVLRASENFMKQDGEAEESNTQAFAPAHSTTNDHAEHESLAGDVDSVMLGFQDLMAKFLETQRSVMQQYLAGESLGTGSMNTESLGTGSLNAGSLDTGRDTTPTPIVSVPLPLTKQSVTTQPSPVPRAMASSTNDVIAPTPNRDSAAESTVPETLSPTNRSIDSATPAVEPISSAPAPQMTASQTTAPQMTMDEVATKLVALVSERTGYPEDMLDANLDLEGDLGIDSIKRVEILGDLAESLGIIDEDENDPRIELEKLTTIRTLQGILNYLETSLYSIHTVTGSADPTSSQSLDEESPATNDSAAVADAPRTESTISQTESRAADGPANGRANGQTLISVRSTNDASRESVAETNGEATIAVQRGLIHLVPSPIAARGGMPIPAGAIVITDDRRGIAVQLAERFADFGQEVVLLRNSSGPTKVSNGTYEGDLTSAAAVAEILARVRADVGPVAGLVHLLPLAAASDIAWAERADVDVKSFYLLCRDLQNELVAASENGLAFVLTPTSLGGGLGFADLVDPDAFFAGQGGVIGFAKCFAQEASGVLVRAVDFPSAADPNDICEALLNELTEFDGPGEVGYRDGQRVTWQPVAGDFAADRMQQLTLDSKSVVLLTGGARGITAAVAIEIARRYQSHLVLVGRSPVPSAESSETSKLQSVSKLKSALIARRKAARTSSKPAEVEAEFKALMRDREIRATIAAIKAAGSKVTYDSMDVRNEQAFANLIQQIRKHYGRLDGVIHGAGVIEDKLIRDKTPESFDRVFGTKVRSAWNLSQYIAGDDLKFCVFFASVASRYGNKGQADYAAANEVLTKLAADLDRRWSARVFAVDWGPWSEIGMVADLEKHLTARGVTLISPVEGTEHLLRELEFGAKGETEIIIAGGAERLAIPQSSVSVHA